MIKAVIFDVDGILVDSREANIAFYQKLLPAAGYPPVGREAVLACFHLPLRGAIQKLTGVSESAELERIFNIGNNFSLRDADLFEFPKELEEVLSKLRREYRLAIATSRTRLGMDHVFSARQIKQLFDVVVTFEDYDNPKPHPEPLQVALKQLELSSNEAVYVGDSFTDIEAAKSAGMKSIYIAAEPHQDATLNISSFDRLLDAVESLDH